MTALRSALLGLFCLFCVSLALVAAHLAGPRERELVVLDAGTGPGFSGDLRGLNDAVLAQRAWAEAQRAVYVPPRHSADWDAIARCETGGNWSMTGSRFSGGVGFANTTWDGFGGREFADLAGHATREEQIIVAERVYRRYGLSGWGCRAYG